jgi:hypothetical protein
MHKLIIVLIIAILTLNCTYAWTSYTHTWICERAGLSDLDCASADYPKTQSIYHDASFVNHHCSLNASDCRARITAEKFLMNSTPETLGIAAHLYADSLVPVHWYSTDYDTCHKIFEDKVEEKLKTTENIKYVFFGSSFDMSAWNITMQCTTTDKTHQSVMLYADDKYMEDVARYVAEKMNATYTSNDVKEYDLNPIIYSVIIILIVITVLFFYFGLKNRKK